MTTQPELPQLVYFSASLRDDAELEEVGQRIERIFNLPLRPYVGRRTEYPQLESTALGLEITLTEVHSLQRDAPRRYAFEGTQPYNDQSLYRDEVRHIDDWIHRILQRHESGWYVPSWRELNIDSGIRKGRIQDLEKDPSFATRALTDQEKDLLRWAAAPPRQVHFTLRVTDVLPLAELAAQVNQILSLELVPRPDSGHPPTAWETRVLGLHIVLVPLTSAPPGQPITYQLSARPAPDDPTPYGDEICSIDSYVQHVLNRHSPGRWSKAGASAPSRQGPP